MLYSRYFLSLERYLTNGKAFNFTDKPAALLKWSFDSSHQTNQLIVALWRLMI